MFPRLGSDGLLASYARLVGVVRLDHLPRLDEAHPGETFSDSFKLGVVVEFLVHGTRINAQRAQRLGCQNKRGEHHGVGAITHDFDAYLFDPFAVACRRR